MSKNQSNKPSAPKRDESLFFVRLFVLMALITLYINVFVDKRFEAASASGPQEQIIRVSIAMTAMTAFTGVVALVLSKGRRRWMCGGLILVILVAAIRCNYFAGMLWHGMAVHFR